jgi:hypothetical protein
MDKLELSLYQNCYEDNLFNAGVVVNKAGLRGLQGDV